MTALLIALAIVAAYLVAGWRIAIAQLPVAWSVARREWGLEISAGDGSYLSKLSEDYTRASVRWQTAGMFLFWPVYLTVRYLRGRLDGVIDAGDPVALAAKVGERDARIAQLERELGIGR